MRIHHNGDMELTAEENQMLMDRLEILPEHYDDPPVQIEYLGTEDEAIRFKATNTATGLSLVLTFDADAET